MVQIPSTRLGELHLCLAACMGVVPILPEPISDNLCSIALRETLPSFFDSVVIVL